MSRGCSRRHQRDDRGSATIWMLCGCTVVVALVVATLAVGAALVARHRASVVADLAALAAAQALVEGRALPCRSAARIATAQGGRLVSCSVVGEGADTVEVVAEVQVSRTTLLAAVLPPARARARAGPAAPGNQ